MTVRIVATDLDGTLLHSDGTVSARTRDALLAAGAGGILVVLVTGRPPRWLDEVAEATAHTGVAVSANGAVLYDMATEQIVGAHYLQPELMREIATDLRAAFPATTFAVEYGDGFAAEPDYVHDWAINPRTDRRGRPIPPPQFGDLATITARNGVKLLAKDRGADVDQFLIAADELLAGRASVTHSSTFGLLEIAAPGVTKATGLAEIAGQHQIPASDVIAVGDMPNDVPMLTWAGRGYAVANAHAATKAAADEVIGSNDDDAVAALIEVVLTAQA